MSSRISGLTAVRDTPAARLVKSVHGFTLVELATVVTIIGILATLAVPNYQYSTQKAREAVLKQTLFVLRDVIDKYRGDKGKYPPTLADLVTAGYLRVVPADPLTGSASTWQEMQEDQEGGIWDVHSGSPLVSLANGPYNEW